MSHQIRTSPMRWSTVEAMMRYDVPRPLSSDFVRWQQERDERQRLHRAIFLAERLINITALFACAHWVSVKPDAYEEFLDLACKPESEGKEFSPESSTGAAGLGPPQHQPSSDSSNVYATPPTGKSTRNSQSTVSASLRTANAVTTHRSFTTYNNALRSVSTELNSATGRSISEPAGKLIRARNELFHNFPATEEFIAKSTWEEIGVAWRLLVSRCATYLSEWHFGVDIDDRWHGTREAIAPLLPGDRPKLRHHLEPSEAAVAIHGSSGTVIKLQPFLLVGSRQSSAKADGKSVTDYTIWCPLLLENRTMKYFELDGEKNAHVLRDLPASRHHDSPTLKTAASRVMSDHGDVELLQKVATTHGLSGDVTFFRTGSASKIFSVGDAESKRLLKIYHLPTKPGTRSPPPPRVLPVAQGSSLDLLLAGNDRATVDERISWLSDIFSQVQTAAHDHGRAVLDLRPESIVIHERKASFFDPALPTATVDSTCAFRDDYLPPEAYENNAELSPSIDVYGLARLVTAVVPELPRGSAAPRDDYREFADAETYWNELVSALPADFFPPESPRSDLPPMLNDRLVAARRSNSQNDQFAFWDLVLRYCAASVLASREPLSPWRKKQRAHGAEAVFSGAPLSAEMLGEKAQLVSRMVRAHFRFACRIPNIVSAWCQHSAPTDKHLDRLLDQLWWIERDPSRLKPFVQTTRRGPALLAHWSQTREADFAWGQWEGADGFKLHLASSDVTRELRELLAAPPAPPPPPA